MISIGSQKYKQQKRRIMKNKILLTTIMAFLGILTFSTVAEAHHGREGRGRHNHVFNRFGNRTVVWHNSYNQCGNGWGYNNHINNRMCMHMRNIWRGGRCGARAVVRCNHRGCGMFGSSFRNGRFFNAPRGHGHFNGRGNRGGRYNRGGGRGNGGRYNQGGGRGNGGRYNQGGGRGNGGRYNQGGGRGNGGNNQGGGRGNGNGNGNGNGRGGR